MSSFLPEHTLLTRRLEKQLRAELPEWTPYSSGRSTPRGANQVTGPIITATPVTDPFYHEMKVSYRQRRPYVQPLPHFYGQGGALGPFNNVPYEGSRWRSFAEYPDDSLAYEKARSKLVDKLGDPAAIGITLAQWKQADGMIGKRAGQLNRLAIAVIRRDLHGIASALGMTRRGTTRLTEYARKRHWLSIKLSDLWLELWFGWLPAVHDIYTASEVFDRPIPWGFYKAARTMREYDVVVHPGTDLFSERLIFSRTAVRVSLGVPIRIANVNTFLMQQFGILNAGQVAWDAIPWSFVLDWFWNVNSWLGSFTDLAGLDVGQGWKSTTKKVFGSTSWKSYPEKGGVGWGVEKRRVLIDELAQPKLFRKRWSLAPTRALTAMSLLMQQLDKIQTFSERELLRKRP